MDSTHHANALSELATVRDWLRFAASRFNEAGLVYGHGTASALDEAAFLILHSLHLPIDTLDPWLDARLTAAERSAILALIESRITSRKPAAYLTNTAYIQGHRFYVDERVIVPRSYIGELLARGSLYGLIANPDDVSRVLDLCTGSGCLAILAALSFPHAAIDAADISADALAVARRNVDDYELDDRITLRQGDLLAPVRDCRYDLILANPPYVAGAEVNAFPPEYAAEPVLAHLGGDDGLDLVRRILADAGDHLAHNGTLIVEIGTGRERLEAEWPDIPFLWLETEESSGEVFALTAGQLAGIDRP